MLLLKSNSVKEFIKEADEIGKDGYRGVAMNMLMADNSGDIGYIMLLPSVNRRDKTPYIGSRVLDGTVSDYDWDGLLPLSANPRSINPQKGFISTANNRQVPENSLYDAGSSQMSTTRS